MLSLGEPDGPRTPRVDYWQDRALKAEAALNAARAEPPVRRGVVDMVLFCPKCGLQHIDQPFGFDAHPMVGGTPTWTNPPHRSHLCLGCGHIWRPADIATNGVAEIKTKGKSDSASPVREEGEVLAWAAIAHPETGMGTIVGCSPANVERDADELYGPGHYDLIALSRPSPPLDGPSRASLQNMQTAPSREEIAREADRVVQRVAKKGGG